MEKTKKKEKVRKGKIPKLKMVMLIFFTHFLNAEWFPSYHSFKSLYLNIILGQTIGVVVV